MSKERILITVKTYPTPSSKYDELVCTAGLREDGSWIRIYPVEFRKKPYSQQYSKYQWIEIDLEKRKDDFRKESFRPKTAESEIKIIDEIKPDGGSWDERRKFVLKKIYTDLETLISEAKNKKIGTSLAVFKPTIIDDFKIKGVEREWNKKHLDRMQQLNIFQTDSEGKFEIVRKLPFKFSYQLTDSRGKSSTMMIEDWELGQLYWNMLKRHGGNEENACADVKKKYFDDFAKKKDLHLFLGTTLQHHNCALNPFIIIGTFHPKPITQLSMF